MRPAALFLLAACFALQAGAAEPLTRVEIVYNVGSLLGDATVTETLETKGHSYSIVSDTVADGLLALVYHGKIERTSRGIVTPQGLRPSEFRDERTGRPLVVARFDWDKKTLTLDDGGSQDTVKLPADTYDRLSFPYSFAFRPAPAKALRFFMTDGKHLSDYHYLVAGTTTLATPLGNLETLHLVEQHAQGERWAEIWLAPKYHMLPVRILFTDKDGGTLDQVATKIRY